MKKLKIDGENIAYRLEEEKTIADLLHSLKLHLRPHYSTILSIAIDGENCGLQEIPAKYLSDISELEVTTLHMHEMLLQKLTFLRKLIIDLQEASEDDKHIICRELGKERKDLELILRSFIPSTELATCVNSLMEVGLHEERTFLLHKTDRLIATIEDPYRDTRDRVSHLSKELIEMQDISVMLQTAEKPKSLALLGRFCEGMQLLLYGYSLCLQRDQSLDALELESLQANLVALQKEMTQENSDVILLGDMIEYDIIPQTEELLNHIDSQLSSTLTSQV